MKKTLEKTVGCKLIELEVHSEAQRGNLCVLEYDQWVPFKPERTFWIWGVQNGIRRGAHAHRESSQIHICLNGSATIYTYDGKNGETSILNRPDMGLLTGPMVWASFELSSPETCLVVVSSHKYSEKDYIRDFSEFLRLIKGAS